MAAVSLMQVYDELKKIEQVMVTKKDMEQMMETIQIVHNKETMSQLAGSKEDIKLARVRTISSAQDLLAEM